MKLKQTGYDTVDQALEEDRAIIIEIKNGKNTVEIEAEETKPWMIKNGCVYFFRKGYGDIVSIIPLGKVIEISALEPID